MGTLRVLTYNIRHGWGLDERISLERVAMNIVSSRADICGIQEVDRYLPRSGMSDQAKELSLLCDMQYIFGKNLRLPFFSAYGTAILSRLPIVDHINYRLPGKGEPRGLLKVLISEDEREITFFNTHLGLYAGERVEQAQHIKEIIDQTKGPVILTGDLNEEANGQAVSLLLAGGMSNCLPPGIDYLPTFPAQQSQKQIDYILTRGQWQINKAYTINSKASDHLPLVVELEGIDNR